MGNECLVGQIIVKIIFYMIKFVVYILGVGQQLDNVMKFVTINEFTDQGLFHPMRIVSIPISNIHKNEILSKLFYQNHRLVWITLR
jgi:hypothetical protein